MSNAYLIWSFEHDAWWGPSWIGYTTLLADAGRYDLATAIGIVTRANLITVNEEIVPEHQASTYVPAPSYACPRCRRRSFNAHDIVERYCGHCHSFEEL